MKFLALVFSILAITFAFSACGKKNKNGGNNNGGGGNDEPPPVIIEPPVCGNPECPCTDCPGEECECDGEVEEPHPVLKTLPKPYYDGGLLVYGMTVPKIKIANLDPSVTVTVKIDTYFADGKPVALIAGVNYYPYTATTGSAEIDAEYAPSSLKGFIALTVQKKIINNDNAEPTWTQHRLEYRDPFPTLNADPTYGTYEFNGEQHLLVGEHTYALTFVPFPYIAQNMTFTKYEFHITLNTAKRPIEYNSVFNQTVFTWNGEAHELTLKPEYEGALTIVGDTTHTNVGIYYACYKLTDSDNYEWNVPTENLHENCNCGDAECECDYCLQWRIDHVKLNMTNGSVFVDFGGINQKTYNGSPITAQIGFAQSSWAQYFEIKLGGTETNIGDYEVTIGLKPALEVNGVWQVVIYNGSQIATEQEITLTWKIVKGDPTVIVAVSGYEQYTGVWQSLANVVAIEYGDELPHIALGAGSTAGTIKWVKAVDNAGVISYVEITLADQYDISRDDWQAPSYQWYFVPTDTVNYNAFLVGGHPIKVTKKTVATTYNGTIVGNSKDNGDGTWSVTLPPLEDDFADYMYSTDGVYFTTEHEFPLVGNGEQPMTFYIRKNPIVNYKYTAVSFIVQIFG